MRKATKERLVQLRSDLQRLLEEANGLSENRKAADMSAEEIERLEAIDQEVDYLQQQIRAEERAIRLAAIGEAQRGGQEPPAGGDGGGRRTPPTPRHRFTDPRAGFGNLGEFAQAVACAGKPNAVVDDRLAVMAPTSYSNEGAGADGGFLIPPEFSTRVMEYVGEAGGMFSRVEAVPISHSLEWPVDQEAPWSTSGPVAYWEGEGDQYTQSKLKLRTAGLKLNKLVALCPVTDELMEDAPQLAAYLNSVISRKMRFKVDWSILRGTGAGMPLGILNSPCLKSTTRATTSHVGSADIFLLYSGLYSDFRSNAVWIYNQDVEPDLWAMVVAGASSDVPVYLPAGTPYANLANAPNGTLFGRPVIPHQACSTLGTVGDIVAGDLGQYVIGYKSLGPVMASSIHLYFDYGMTAVRATWRLCGMPKWSTTIPALNGSATYSAFVTVAT